MSTEPTSSQQSDEGLVEDLDVDQEAGKDVAGGARRATSDPCEGGEYA